MIKRTLEQRIARIERLLKNEARLTKKFESFESDLDEDSARAAADRIAAQFGKMLGVSVTPDDYGNDVVNSPMYGWLPTSAVDEIEEDPDARFGFHYNLDDGEFGIEVYPTDNAVNLINEDGYSVDPAGRFFSSDMADIVAFPLRKWKGFDLSMVHDEDDDDDYNVGPGEDFNDYYDESKCQTRRPTKSESARKSVRRVRR